MGRDELSRRTLLSGIGGTAALVGSAGCTALSDGGVAGDDGGTGSVTVGSKAFVENQLLGTMALETLRRNTSLDVVDETGYGPTGDVWDGLTGDALDLYWEYTGTLRITFPPEQEDLIADPEAQYADAKRQTEVEYDLTVLERAPINNTYALLAAESWVAETGVATLSGFAEYVNDGHTDTTIALGPSFYDRADGWPGLLDAYGFEDEAAAAWEPNVQVVSPGLTYEFVRTGDADLAMGFLTDPQILELGLEPLVDDENFWPVYAPAPVVRTPLVEEHPELVTELDQLGSLIEDDATMRELNGRVILDDESIEAVATSFLEANAVI